VQHFVIVAHCERLLTTAFCADENLVSAVASFDQLEPQFATTFVALRPWRRLGHGTFFSPDMLRREEIERILRLKSNRSISRALIHINAIQN
jgi:hypothetical protein